jgi:hypothetical protein
MFFQVLVKENDFFYSFNDNYNSRSYAVGGGRTYCIVSNSDTTLVDLFSKPDNTAPSLHFHYKSFSTTTGCSAPILHIGTLILMGLPLGFLP